MRQLRLVHRQEIFGAVLIRKRRTSFGIARLTCHRCSRAMLRHQVGQMRLATCGHIWLQSRANLHRQKSLQVF